MSALQFGVPQTRLPELPHGGIEGLNVHTRRYPSHLLLDVIDAAFSHTQDTAIGVRFGLNLRPERKIDVIYALTFCENLQEAMELNIAYQPLIQEIGRTDLEITDQIATCVWNPHEPDHPCAGFMSEAVFSGYASIGRWLLWTNTPPIRMLQFKHDRPDRIDIQKTIFGDKIAFNADRNALEFSRAALGVPLAGRNKAMVKRLRVQMDQMLANLNRPNDLIEDVKAQIKGDISKGQFSIKDIASTLGQSERTLRRRLEAEETSFRTLLSECRQEMAEIYMADHRLSLADIAQELSFNDQSAFSRAFKSWTGETPQSYRKREKDLG